MLDDNVVVQLAERTPLEELMQLACAVRQVKRADPDVITFSPKVFIPLTRLCRDRCAYCTFAIRLSSSSCTTSGDTKAPAAPVDSTVVGSVREAALPGAQRAFLTVDEVLSIARSGEAAGCTEALFTLGDKPELVYPQAKQELSDMGFSSTVEYVAHAAHQVLTHTTLLPHINAGVMPLSDVLSLRKVSASQGLMLECGSERLMEPGGPHFGCPDKLPAARLETIRAAGEARVPFTSGILIGIGETHRERILSLLALRKLHREYGHIQEIIVQNFRAKEGTPMASFPEPSLEELQWSVAVARMIFGADMGIQAPPNLTPGSSAPDSWRSLLAAGASDWGGVSPVTKDWVNPEAPWPHIADLASATAASGKLLLPRLPIYPSFLQQKEKWLDSGLVTRHALHHSDSHGYARCQAWAPGTALPPPPLPLTLLLNQLSPNSATSPSYTPATAYLSLTSASSSPTSIESPQKDSPLQPIRAANGGQGMNDGGQGTERRSEQRDKLEIGCDGMLSFGPPPLVAGSSLVSSGISGAVRRALRGNGISQAETEALFSARGSDFEFVCAAANDLRAQVNGDKVSYVINRNINYTNVCTFACHFCAFSKGKADDVSKDAPYLLPLEEIARRATEASDRGATEVCMQGGIHPQFTGDSYLSILRAVKRAAPRLHVHAFSPLEVLHGAQTLQCSPHEFLSMLKDEGIGSLPGTAAEILHDDVRRVICPDKLNSQQWLEVVGAAHSLGIPTTSTIMFGHSVDTPSHWAHHLLLLRQLQQRTGGITEFVPLPFVHMQAPMYLKGVARRGPTMRESVLMHAVARLALHPHITNIQASWVKMGPAGAQALLHAGCNDLGGCLMNESITRAAGAVHGQELNAKDMVALITSAGRIPVQRTTTYGCMPSAEVAA